MEGSFLFLFPFSHVSRSDPDASPRFPFLQTIEARLQSDLTELSKERSTLELLNQNLRNVEAENVRTQTESRQKSEVHITNLERDR